MPEDIDPRKLMEAVKVGFEKMRHHRKVRMRILAQYVGRFYQRTMQDWREDNKAFPINLMHKAVTTLVPNLVYADPKARVTTNYMAYREYAEVLALATNHLSYEINLRHTLRQCITDAIILVGWIKTGIGTSSQTIDLDGVEHDPGQPYADRVDPDDMTIDPFARTLEEAYFIGNRFRISKTALFESELINAADIEKLGTRYDYPNWSEATTLSNSHDSMSYMAANTGLVEYVDLVEVYLPTQNLIMTVPYDPGGTGYSDKMILREVEYEGPERGPYHMLGFAFAPDNIMPVAPAQMWYDLHMMANRVARKIARQSDRQKRVLAYEASAWEDAADIVDADDGESIRVDDVDAIKEIDFGGANEEGYQYMEWAERHFSDVAMNIDLLSGSASNENTATQAEIVQANTSVRLSDMQNLVYQFTGDVMGDMMFFLHTDPLIELPLVKRTHGQDQQVHYTPEMREGDWMDYNVRVIPYSMGRQDPNIRVRRLMEFTGNGIPALGVAFQTLGPAFNMEAAVNLLGREMGIEELDQIINSEALQQMTQRMQQLLEQGVPLDQKAIKMITNPLGAQVAGVLEPGSPDAEQGARINQGQPNPRATMKSGVGPDQERNAMAQETAGELQSTYVGSQRYAGRS